MIIRRQSIVVMYFNSQAKSNNKQHHSPYQPSNYLYLDQKMPSFEYMHLRSVRLQPKQFQSKPIGLSPVHRTPVRENKQQICNYSRTQSIKNGNHRKYFEKPELRLIKPISSNAKGKPYYYTPSQTQSSTAIKSQITYKQQPISLDWNHIRRKTETNLFKKFTLGCHIERPKQTSFCCCEKPCQWAKRWSSWAKMPKQSVYSQLKQRMSKPQVDDQIQKDLKRTQPGSGMHEFSYLRMLKQVLEVYSKYDEVVGYIQGMNMLTSVILHHVKNTEQTFWILVDLMERRQYRQIYLNDFKRLKVHTNIVNRLVQYKINDLYLHLLENGVQLEMITTGWFFSLMCNIIPLSSAHLMVDIFITEGFLGFYKVIITYLLYLKEELMIKDDTSDILNRFSSTHPQDDVDWQMILDSAVYFRLNENDLRMLG